MMRSHNLIIFMRVAALAIASCLFTVAAAASVYPCEPREAMVETLRGAGERVTGVGVVTERMTLELFTNEDRTSFSLVYTTADGMSCLVVTGTDWQEILDAFDSEASDHD